jgi:hypothetical protein
MVNPPKIRLNVFLVYYWILAYLATNKEEHQQYKSKVQGLLPKVVGIQIFKPVDSNLNLVLKRWKNLKNDKGEDDQEMQAIAECLENAIQRQRSGMIVFAVLILSSILVIIFGVPATVTTAQKVIEDQTKDEPILPNPIVPCPRQADIIAIACDVPVSDIDSRDFNGGKLTIRFKEPSQIMADEELLIHTDSTGNASELNQIGAANASEQDLEPKLNEVALENGTVIGTYTGGQGSVPLEVTLNESANANNVTSLLSAIAYRKTSQPSESERRNIVVELTDGDGGTSNQFEQILELQPIDESPVLTVPNAQQLEEDNQVNFGGIQVSGSDIGEQDTITIQLSVANGSLTVNENIERGVSSPNIEGQNSNRLTLEGTVKEINTTLGTEQSLTYKGSPDFDQNDTLRVVLNYEKKQPNNSSILIYPPPTEAQPVINSVRVAINPINDDPIIGDRIIISTGEAVNLIESWLNAKKRAYGPEYNFQVISQYTTDEYFARNRGTYRWLTRNRAYYTFGQFRVEPIQDVQSTGDQVATIEVKLEENPTLILSTGDIDRTKSGRTVSNYRFTMEFHEGRWKIAKSDKL